jgi:DnaK suppressor protein
MTDGTPRSAELRQILTARRRDMEQEAQGRIASDTHEVGDVEHSEKDHQGDVDLTLMQMRAETLVRIDRALARLDAGQYGSCLECEREITERRLRALPFAVRCQACEEAREQAEGAARRLAARRGARLLFSEGVGP